MEELKCTACIEWFLFNFDSYEIYTLGLEKKIASEQRSLYDNHVLLNDCKIIDLCVKTLKQSSCNECFMARIVRISVSKRDHSIRTRSTKTIDSLVNDFLMSSEPKAQAKKNFQYGKKNESKAIPQYSQNYDVEVLRVGLVIAKKQPWLCASPEGVVIEEGMITKLLEIKCPISCEKLPIVDHNSNNLNVNYLHFLNGNIELKSSHVYYTQCQLQLYVAEMTICDLFVWYPEGSCLVSVFRNENFLKNLVPKLEELYFVSLLSPSTLNVKDENNYVPNTES